MSAFVCMCVHAHLCVCVCVHGGETAGQKRLSLSRKSPRILRFLLVTLTLSHTQTRNHHIHTPSPTYTPPTISWVPVAPCVLWPGYRGLRSLHAPSSPPPSPPAPLRRNRMQWLLLLCCSRCSAFKQLLVSFEHKLKFESYGPKQ